MTDPTLNYLRHSHRTCMITLKTRPGPSVVHGKVNRAKLLVSMVSSATLEELWYDSLLAVFVALVHIILARPLGDVSPSEIC